MKKSDVLSEVMTKVPPKEVHKLALEAKELFLGGMRNNKIAKTS